MIRLFCAALFATLIAHHSLATTPSTHPAVDRNALFAHNNLVAWCIVPFDSKKRSPEDRAAMLERIGLKHYAYDWRNEYLPTFEAELNALQKHHIELTAVWFPGAINDEAKFLLDALKHHDLKPQLWVMVAGYPLGADTGPERNFAAAVKAYGPVADAAQAIGCRIGIYNHGGWLGEPENMIELVKRLNRPNVGIVYNLHHGHDQLDRFEKILKQMLPHLMCLNINGMTRDGDKNGHLILPLAQGEFDLQLLRTIRDSGYDGRMGILNHTDEDAEARLLDNMDGLDWLVPQLDRAAPTQPKPKPRSYMPATAPSAAVDYWTAESAEARKKLPMYQTIPAATDVELTPANGWPDAAVYANWNRSHGNDACTRYSPLNQITRENVKSLQIAWTYHSKDGAGNIQCNPIVVNGVMYAPTSGNFIVAVNAATGEELWRFKAEPFVAKRGITFHTGSNGASDRLLFAAGHSLWAIDPNGKPIESFGEHGRIAIPECAVAPAVYQNIIVIAGWYGDLLAFDLYSGKSLWTFHTVPHDGEYGADTWDKADEGANCWGGMALDASRGIAYITTGSPKPNFIGSRHRGDNLFANCVVAIDVSTGKRLWHFQEVHHDIWDFDIPAPPVLVTVNHNGRRVDAVVGLSKFGNTLLLDRVTGKPLFPFRMRRAASTVLGEVTAPYQPDVQIPEPFARQVFTKDDVTSISPKSRRFILDKIENAKFGWFEPPEQGKLLVSMNINGGAEWTGGCFDPQTGFLYVNSNEIPWTPAVYRSERPAVDETKLPATPGRLVYQQNCMACHGPSREGLGVAASLLGISARLKDEDITKLVHTGRGNMPAFKQMDDVKMNDLLAYLSDRDRPNIAPTTRPERPSYRDGGYPRLLDQDGYPGCKPPWGTLNAIDLNTGKIVWKVPLGEYEELTKRGIPITGTENFGGPIVTAGGLVFCSGTRDLKIRAFDKQTGQELWSSRLPFSGSAAPTTYEVHGKQYVVIASCGGGKLETPTGDCYVAFALP